MSETTPLASTEQCRICLEDDIPSNMAHPCLCSGTNKYVHDECLKQWIIISDNPEYKTKCPTCHYEYIMTNNSYNEDVIRCNSYYEFISVNTWQPFFMNQGCLIFFTFVIALVDMNRTNTKALYDTLYPIISNITEFNSSPFYVYYSFVCFLFVTVWILIITLNIFLLKNRTMIYLKTMNPCVIIVSPFLFYTAVYLNMLSVVIGTFVLTKLIQLWVKHHLHTITLIRTVVKFQIKNYQHNECDEITV